MTQWTRKSTSLFEIKDMFVYPVVDGEEVTYDGSISKWVARTDFSEIVSDESIFYQSSVSPYGYLAQLSNIAGYFLWPGTTRQFGSSMRFPQRYKTGSAYKIRLYAAPDTIINVNASIFYLRMGVDIQNPTYVSNNTQSVNFKFDSTGELNTNIVYKDVSITPPASVSAGDIAYITFPGNNTLAAGVVYITGMAWTFNTAFTVVPPP